MNRIATLRLGLLALAVISTTLSADAADWSRFRGPNGTGISDDKQIPVQWTAKNIQWKVAIPGKGHSSPIVSKGRIFFQTTSDDFSKRYLLCFNTEGKELWRKDFPGGNAKTHPLNSPASSTCAADGERVYTAFWDGKNLSLYAHDYEGKEIWKQELGEFVNEHGMGFSPMVAGDKVIVSNDQGNQQHAGPAEVQAFEAKTGKPAWQAKREGFRASFATPMLLDKVDAGPELIVSSTAGVTSYNPKDGKLIWHHKWVFEKAPLRAVGSPVFLDGMIFASAGDGGGSRSLLALKPNGTKVEKVWEKNKGTPYVPSIIGYEGHLYWLNDKENVAVCASAKTGDIAWSERLGTGVVSASPVLVDGKIYSITESGTVYVFKAATEYKLLSKYDLGEGVMSTPAVADGKMYIRGQKNLFCIAK